MLPRTSCSSWLQCSACFGTDSSMLCPPKLKSHLPSWHTEVQFAAYFRADEVRKLSDVPQLDDVETSAASTATCYGKVTTPSRFPRKLAPSYGVQCIFSRDLKSLEGKLYSTQRNKLANPLGFLKNYAAFFISELQLQGIVFHCF